MQKRAKSIPKICCQTYADGRVLAYLNVPLPNKRGKKRYERKYLGRYGSPEAAEEYRRFRENWKKNNGILASAPESLSIAGLCREFMAFCRGDYSATSHEPEKYFRILAQLVNFCGTESVEDFGLVRFEQYRTSLVDSERYCRREINDRVRRIKYVFSWAAQRRLVSLTVNAEVQLLKSIRLGRSRARENEPVQPVPLEHVLKTLPLLSTPIQAMVRLQLITGCRPEEIRIMRPCDLDREIKNGCWRYIPAHDKTQQFRSEHVKKIVPLNEAAQKILWDFLIYLPDDSKEYLFRPEDSVGERKRVKAANGKTPKTPSRKKRDEQRKSNRKTRYEPFYSADSYRRALARAAKKAGVPHWFPYQLRHTSATEVRRRFGIEAAQLLLGHKSVTTTLIYAEQDTSEAEKLAEKLSDMI